MQGFEQAVEQAAVRFVDWVDEKVREAQAAGLSDEEVVRVVRAKVEAACKVF